jgi:phosphatidylserine/phosphatidylglycerophosphate/cardiolipin synthase-like enzyme
MKIFTTPWKNEFLELVSNSRTSIKITSPFVKENICSEIFKAKSRSSTFELITTFKLMNVYTGSLDLSALELIISNSGVVKNHSKLHSKIYLFDDEKAVITSGNLTTGGLLRNYEYGILIEDESTVTTISDDFSALSNHENTGVLKRSDINTVRAILANIPKTETIKLPSYKFETPEDFFDVIEAPTEAISATLSGWKLDVFNCLNSFANQEFSLTRAYNFEGLLRKKHPNNTKIKDKIRQQLQELRDSGLIEFLGRGRYRKLWR